MYGIVDIYMFAVLNVFCFFLMMRWTFNIAQISMNPPLNTALKRWRLSGFRDGDSRRLSVFISKRAN